MSNHPLARLRHHVTGAIERGEKTAIVEKRGQFRTRQTGYEFVLEELRNGSWVIIESLFSWDDVEQAHAEYSADGHTIEHK